MKIFRTIICLFTTLLAISATGCAKFDTMPISRTFNVEPFNKIDIASAFEVELVQSDNYLVNVNISTSLEKYLVVRVENGTLFLNIDTKAMPLSLRNFINTTRKATISVPAFSEITISGASAVRSHNSFETQNFKATISGASSLKHLSVDAENAIIEGSGASEIALRLTANSCDVTLSGASECELVGECTDSTIEASGASEYEAEGFKSSTASVDLSGASEADILVFNQVSVKMSGASELTYRAPESVIVNKISITGASSLRHRSIN